MNKREYWQEYYKRKREVILLKRKIRRLNGNATTRPQRETYWQKGSVWVVTDGDKFVQLEDMTTTMVFNTKTEAQNFVDNLPERHKTTLYPLQVFYKYKVGIQDLLEGLDG